MDRCPTCGTDLIPPELHHPRCIRITHPRSLWPCDCASAEKRYGPANQMGYKDAAIRLLSNDDEIREALGIAAPDKAARTETPAAVQPASLQVQSN